MHERLLVGLIAVVGKQGEGKTSLGNARLANDWKYHGEARYKEAKGYYTSLNKEGYNLTLPKNKVLYYCSEETYLDKKKGIKTWFIDPLKFKLPNLKDDVQYVPRGSVIFLPEYDRYINCRDWQNMDKWLIALAKYARHWGITIIMDFQSWLQIDISYRRLMMYLWYVYESDWKHAKPFWAFWRWLFHLKIKRIWHYVYCDTQLNTFVKDLGDMATDGKVAKKLKKRVSKDCHYVFKGNIFDYYTSTSGEPYFLRGISDYKYIPHKPVNMSPAGVEEFCKDHPLVKEIDEQPIPRATSSKRQAMASEGWQRM